MTHYGTVDLDELAQAEASPTAERRPAPPPSLAQRLRDKLIPVVDRVQPVARVAERVAQIAVHLRKPTAIGMVGLAGAALSSLSDQLGNSKTPGWELDLLVSRGVVMQAAQEAGARVAITRHADGSETAQVDHLGSRFWVYERGSIYFGSAPPAELLDWLRQAIDRVLPPAVEIRSKASGRNGERCASHAFKLTEHDNAQAAEVIAATAPLLDGGRCILLDGKPGVGKTTMAQIIARHAGLGRTVLLDGSIVGNRISDGGATEAIEACSSASDLRDSLKLLTPGVVIVDDVDKVMLSLSRLEALRAAARLVILTANNGEYDEVLDGAIMRAGRVDEVFPIAPAKLDRVAPFDRLSDAEWTEVSQWPVAYVVEVRKRLAHRPGELRLDDLRARLTRKTNSRGMLR